MSSRNAKGTRPDPEMPHRSIVSFGPYLIIITKLQVGCDDRRRPKRALVLTPGGVVGHAERREAVGALDVEHVEVLRVRHVAVVVAAAREALQDLPRHGARVAARRRRAVVLRQHHRAARHHAVLDLAHCSGRNNPTPGPVARMSSLVQFAPADDRDRSRMHVRSTLFVPRSLLAVSSPPWPPLARVAKEMEGSREPGSEQVGQEREPPPEPV